MLVWLKAVLLPTDHYESDHGKKGRLACLSKVAFVERRRLYEAASRLPKFSLVFFNAKHILEEGFYVFSFS